VPSFPDTRTKEAAGFSETFVLIKQIARRHKPQSRNSLSVRT